MFKISYIYIEIYIYIDTYIYIYSLLFNEHISCVLHVQTRQCNNNNNNNDNISSAIHVCIYIYIERERDRCICIIRIRVRLRMMIILFDDSDTISGGPTESCMYIMCVCIPTQKHFARSYNRHVFGMIMYMLMIIN